MCPTYERISSAAIPCLQSIACRAYWIRWSGGSAELGIHQALTAPYAHDRDSVCIPSVDDAEGWMLQLAQRWRVELRDNLAALRERAQLTHAITNLCDEPHTDCRYTLGCVPLEDISQVIARRLGDFDSSPRHGSSPSERMASSSDMTRPASISESPTTTARMKSRSSCAASYSSKP